MSDDDTPSKIRLTIQVDEHAPLVLSRSLDFPLFLCKYSQFQYAFSTITDTALDYLMECKIRDELTEIIE